MSKHTSFIHHPFVRVLQHLAFWVLSYFVFLNLFKTGIRAERVDHIYTLLFHATLLPPVYLHLEWLLPRFAKKRTAFWYALMLAALVFIFSWINYLFFQRWSSVLLPDYFFISYFTLAEVSVFFITYIGLSALLKLSRSWFAVTELERRLLQAEKDKVQIELKALRSQINPHFFFNTLNSIYSMALEKDDRLPNTILQLSELMRYFLYESRGDMVPLEKELAVLQDYISLQRIRSGEKLETVIDMQGQGEQFKIAPLLLITFVENAFKHGAKGNTGKTYVHLALKVEANTLNFRLENSMGTADDITLADQKGVGLENVSRRLQLLYPGKYQLQTGQENNSFIVQLKLELQHV
jgi:sensor histidine kinase YesM